MAKAKSNVTFFVLLSIEPGAVPATEIRRVLEQNSKRQGNFGTIYRVLERLERLEWITSVAIASERSRRPPKHYDLTPLGTQRLQELISDYWLMHGALMQSTVITNATVTDGTVTNAAVMNAAVTNAAVTNAAVARAPTDSVSNAISNPRIP